MTTNEIKNLSDDELEKKHQHFNNLFKGVAAAFVITTLIGIGYAGYADAKGYEESYGLLPVLFILFAGLIAVFYFELSKFKSEISKRENSNQS